MIVRGLKTIALLGICVSANALTLEESLVSAYENNEKLQAKREEILITNEVINEAYSGFLPQVSYNYSNERIKRMHQAGIPIADERTDRNISQSLRLVQELFAGGKTLAAIEKAKYIVRQAHASLHQQESQTLFEAVSSYTDMLYKKDLLKASEVNYQSQVQHYNATKAKYDAGISTKTQVALSEQSKAIAESNLLAAKGSLQNAESKFRLETGMEPKKLSAILLKYDLPKNLQEAIDYAKNHNPQMVAARNDLNVSDSEIKEAAARFWPVVTFQALVSQADQDAQTGVATRSEVTLKDKKFLFNVNVPIFQSGTEYINLRKAEAKSLSKRSSLSRATQDVRNIVIQSWTNYQTSKAALKAAKQSYESAKIALTGAQQEYDEGLMSITDLIDTRNKKYDSETRMHKAQKDVNDSFFGVLFSIGRLTAKDLSLPTKYEAIEAKYLNK